MIESEVVIKNKTGLHARPAAVLVEAADRFKSEIYITFAGVKVNAKSIIGVLSLGIGQNDSIKITIEGRDEEEALEALVNIVNNQFGENWGSEGK